MTDVFEKLAAKHPWPEVEGVTPWDYTLGGGGRELVENILKQHDLTRMLEIGCFMCSSTRRWLSFKPDLKLVGVDPWDDGLIEQVRRYIGRPNLTRKYPDIEDQKRFAKDVETQGPFPTALSNVADFKDRFVPVRDYAPEALYELKEDGFEPELVYIDANKQAIDLEVCHELWPNAFITGDDWHWSKTKGYPMRQVVYAFAEKYGFTVEAEWATWILKR